MKLLIWTHSRSNWQQHTASLALMVFLVIHAYNWNMWCLSQKEQEVPEAQKVPPS